jgi:hypothetical protein
MRPAAAHSSREDRMRLTRSLLVGSLALVLVACAGGSRPAYEVPITADDLTTTHVVNTNSFPVTVYLTQAGMRYRLGVVESLSANLFMVPPQVMVGRRNFRLLASPLGPHPTFLSETFMLQPGQTAAWRVQESTSRDAVLMSLVSVH